MCGLIGYCGEEPAAPLLVKALQHLEYRGYDSAGIATIADGRVQLKKDVGKLGEVRQKHQLDDLPGTIGVGHVRWATHGGVTQANAHPHTDCTKKVAVVHNGIIQNHRELRSRLEAKHAFVSETDTEVIPHLLEEHLTTSNSLEQAVLKTTRELEGSYALVIMSSQEPEKLVATCKDNPLVVGKSRKGNFIASDDLAFPESVTQIAFMEDDETAVVVKDNISFFTNDGHRIEKKFIEPSWNSGEVSKQNYPHFMLKEIMENSQSIRGAMVQDKKLITHMAMDILRAKQIIFTACGTSRYAALVGRYLFSKLAGKFSDVIISSEFHYFSDSIDKNTLVIALSQSGETADVMDGAKLAKKKGAKIFSLVNRNNSSLARMSDRVLYLNCGAEIGVAATKSFSSQLTLLYMLAFAMSNRLDEGLEKLNEVSIMVEKNFSKNGKNIEELAWRTKDKNDFYYIARGINFAIASEGALKLKEVSYAHAEGMPAGELKHGTLALIEEGVPVIAICPSDHTLKETLSNIEETRARGAFIVGISDQYNPIFHEWIEIPSIEYIYYPLLTIVPLQLLAYHSAIARGKDPDKPRNLAKSVTVK